jgi:Undecaprenyl-phosphate galactose phosphotransferase WbaP
MTAFEPFRPPVITPLSQSGVLPFRERASTVWLTVLVDLLAVQLCLALGCWLRNLVWVAPVPWMNMAQFGSMGTGLLALPLVNRYLGLHPGYMLGPVETLRRRTCATAAVFGALLAFDNLAYHGQWSRGSLVIAFALALVVPPLANVLLRHWLIRAGRWGVPVLVLGAGVTGRAMVRIMKDGPELGLVPVAFLDDDQGKWGTRPEGVAVAGPISLARELRSSAKTAVVAIPSISHARFAGLVRSLSFSRVIIIPDLLGLETHWVAARDLGGYLGLEIRKHLLHRPSYYAKRVTDYVCGLILFVATLPLIALLAGLIKWASPGPAFYFQWREGLGGRRFKVWKLRTMQVNAEEVLQRYLDENPFEREQWNRFFKLKRDPRIIPFVGTLLRRTSLDELPQFWNVLRGEMSLVGPRPFPDYHLAQFSEEFRLLRRTVLPGLTGSWQVSHRSNGDLMLQEMMDRGYVLNWSPWLDLYLLTRTVRVVVLGSGAY